MQRLGDALDDVRLHRGWSLSGLLQQACQGLGAGFDIFGKPAGDILPDEREFAHHREFDCGLGSFRHQPLNAVPDHETHVVVGDVVLAAHQHLRQSAACVEREMLERGGEGRDARST